VSKAVSNLVPLQREITFDDTFREVNAVLRMDAKLCERDTKVQLLIDFRHKQDKWKSKSHFYGTMSKPVQFENLVARALSVTCFHRLRPKTTPSKDEILACYDEIVKWIRPDVVTLVEILFKDVSVRKRETL